MHSDFREALPLVSVVVPVHNEEKSIVTTLRAIFEQTYPHDRLEVVVVDGRSGDRTRALAETVFAQYPYIFTHLLDNPSRGRAHALNIGIRATRGEVIVRVDGRTAIAPDYVERCVQALGASGADNVGGLMRPIGDSYISGAISQCLSSPFGVGNAAFHYSTRPKFVDTVYLGAFRRDLFDRIGFFDESLSGGEDDEFNFRIRLAGGRVYLDPEIRSAYVPRRTIPALWAQYWHYGYTKVGLIAKYGRAPSWRHFVPATFVGSIILAASASAAGKRWWPLGMLLAPYSIASLLASGHVGIRGGWRYLPVMPPVFCTLHLAYGLGFIAALLTRTVRVRWSFWK